MWCTLRLSWRASGEFSIKNHISIFQRDIFEEKLAKQTSTTAEHSLPERQSLQGVRYVFALFENLGKKGIRCPPEVLVRTKIEVL